MPWIKFGELWWLGTIFGSLSLVALNSLKSTMNLSFKNFWILFPLLVCVQLGYWYGFKFGRPIVGFASVWFIGSGFNAILAILAGLLIFHKAITLNVYCGIALVMIGSFLLVK